MDEKKYKNALEKARQEYNTTNSIERKQWLAELFPELKESGDERIRKALIRYHKSTTDIDGIKGEDIIDWLNKQGEETSWKPSKEEMDVLYGLAYITNKYDEHKEEVITHLYQDLKREFFNGSNYESMFPNTEDDVRRRSIIQVLEYVKSLDTYNQYGKADIDKNITWLEKQCTERKQLYIRFGDIPLNEKSKIYRREKEIGDENGVSVYPAFELNGNIVLGLTLPITKTTLYTQQHLLEYDDRPCYLVTGDYAGKGTDGEPLIRNISIIKRLYNYRIKEIEKQGNTSNEVTCTQEVEVGNGNIKALVTEKIPINEAKPFDRFEGLTDFERTLADICIGWIGEEPGWKEYIKDNANVLLKIAVEKFNSVQDVHFEQKPTDKIEPKFKVGDKIYLKPKYRMPDDDTPIANTVKEIIGIDDDFYRFKGAYIFIEDQDKYELVEQNPVDKVEPKFHEGEWCIDNEDGTIFQIVKVLDNTYTYKTNEGKEYSCTHYSLENDARFWTIDDAKPGDMLATSSGAFIYNGDKGGGSCPGSLCGINTLGDFQTGSKTHWTGKKVYPATKEQCDHLFKKMHEAGYEWDADKKELKLLATIFKIKNENNRV